MSTEAEVELRQLLAQTERSLDAEQALRIQAERERDEAIAERDRVSTLWIKAAEAAHDAQEADNSVIIPGVPER